MVGRSLLGLAFLSLASISCSESGSPLDSAGAPPSSEPSGRVSGVNGPHIGDIWIPRKDGTQKFSLQTGEQTKISEGRAIPTRDGSLFLEILEDYTVTPDPFCDLTQNEDTHLINVKNTRTGEVLGSFMLNREITGAARMSPDGQQVAMYVAEDAKDCGSNIFDDQFTIFTKDGKQLFRNTISGLQAYDWHPNGSLVIVRRVPEIDQGFLVQIETSPGSHEFVDVFSFTAPSDVLYYHALRVGPTGMDAVFEAVIETATPLSGVRYRNANAHHFPLVFDDGLPETDLFMHTNGVNRVNSPTFSPDGKHILVTEGYVSGGAVFFQNYPPLDQIDSLLAVPLHGDNTSYIVPTDVKEQPMPPEQYSENIRPVIANRTDGLGIIGFYPLRELSWTPSID